jgi:hypothetical protein
LSDDKFIGRVGLGCAARTMGLFHRSRETR